MKRKVNDCHKTLQSRQSLVRSFQEERNTKIGVKAVGDGVSDTEGKEHRYNYENRFMTYCNA